MISLVIIVLCSHSVLADTVKYEKVFYDIENVEQHFEEFIKTYNKNYPTEEEKQKRLSIFTENIKKINELNEKQEHVVHGITKFIDLTSEEFINSYTGLLFDPMLPPDTMSCPLAKIDSKDAPESFDWRDKDVVTDVKDQKHCFSCWAFAATAAVESQYALHHQIKLNLSEQELIDCDTKSKGCYGGWPSTALRTLVDLGGQMSQDDYPYIEVEEINELNPKQSCKFNPSKVQAKVTQCHSFMPSDEEELKNILYKYGPIAIGVDGLGLYTYHKGVLPECKFTRINHAVLLVGYGTENGVPFWVIKNSWGKNHGEDGFYRVKRGVNACGLMNGIFDVPVVA